MTGILLGAVFGLVWPPLVSGLNVLAFGRRVPVSFLEWWIRTARLCAVLWVLLGCWPGFHVAWWDAAGSGLSLAIALYLRRRKRRRRSVVKLIGAKARALRDALVWRQRDAWTPRPVLVPQAR